MEKIIVSQVTKIRIGTADVYLENFELGQGKLVISDNEWGYNYSYYWGAMGQKTLEQFLYTISSDYLCDKLLERAERLDFCVKSTFTNVREYIKDEIMPWYEHQEFQKSMRKEIKSFQEFCPDERYFVDNFYRVFSNFDFHLIKNKVEQKHFEDVFSSIEEPWDFSGHKKSSQYLYMEKLYKKLKNHLKGVLHIKKQ